MTIVHVSSVIDGSYSHYIANTFKNLKKNLICIFPSEREVVQVAKELQFFSSAKQISYLGYDSLPFDSSSPSQKSVGKKILALHLMSNIKDPAIILTTSAAILQKTIPKEFVNSNILHLQKKQKIDRDKLLVTLIANGFNRVEIATKPGDFAVRGSILDVIDIFTEDGSRLDFFGNEIEKIRIFDPITQITHAEKSDLTIIPASEVIYTEETISNFKDNYYTTIGKHTEELQTVIAKKRFHNVENYLSYFYKDLNSFFDFIPKNSAILQFDEAQSSVEEYFHTIDEYYSLKKEVAKQRKEEPPIQPEKIWLSLAEYNQNILNYPQQIISNFIGSYENNVENYKILPIFKGRSEAENKSVGKLLKEFAQESKKKVLITALSEGSFTRIKHLLEMENIHFVQIQDFSQINKISGKTMGLAIADLHKGFINDGFAYITENDLFVEKIKKKVRASRRLENFLSEAASFRQGEFVVHSNYGIGRFEGIQTIEVLGIKHDFLQIIYENNDKLFLPVENIELLTSLASDEDNVKLDKLGGVNWLERKARIKNKIRKIAEGILKIAAERELKSANILIPITNIYHEFCARFPYVETEDQIRAIEDIEEDFKSGKPTDRLICGDVGFGKTEIALRAAFIATHNDAIEKSQVAIVVPTTLLCKQHYETFKKRFSGFAVKIKDLSRLTSAKDAKLIKDELKSGAIDIIIGTHSLLSDSIKFKNLQLLIIDEEQHFGVSQKEKLKEMRSDIHVLTLSATPIPRTMQMSLVGIKELSLIATPPVDRLAVKTMILGNDPIVIKDAILREYNRNGRCFFVAPRIAHLNEIKQLLDELVPNIKAKIAHGQMPPSELDQIMYDFYNGKFTVLISTSIVESGLDVQAANTMFIHRADMFGLAALYQLRGRVGRGNVQAYAYLLLPKNKNISQVAKTRLEVMQSLDSLGVGFSVASHDMDIRGFGNLLGDEQSGHVREVGVELYQTMLQDCINELKNHTQEENASWSPQINLGISVLIPDDYIQEIHLRMGIYRRCANLKNDDEIAEFKAELIDRFGHYPSEVEHLLTTVALKIKAKHANIEKIDVGEKGVVISFYNNYFAAADKLLEIAKSRADIKIRADQKIVFLRAYQDVTKRINFAFESVEYLLSL